MIDLLPRLIIRYHGKVYSIPVSHYTCEDLENWGDHMIVKPYFNSERIVVNTLYSDLLENEYFDSNEIILSTLLGRSYKLARISKELCKDTYGYKCFTVITLEQIEVPTPQDFPML